VALSNVGRAAGFGLVGTLKKLMSWDYVLICIAITPFTFNIFYKED
jgi:PAT family beta-lactamase induction signal transducer AmpG